MAMSEPVYKSGRLVGHKCALGHMHPSADLAKACTPEGFSKEETERLRLLKEQKEQATRDHPGFKNAIAVAIKLGADPDAAEAVVLANGVDEVMAVYQSLLALKIPTRKPVVSKPVAPVKTNGDKDDENKGDDDDKKGNGNGKPVPPAPVKP